MPGFYTGTSPRQGGGGFYRDVNLGRRLRRAYSQAAGDTAGLGVGRGAIDLRRTAPDAGVLAEGSAVWGGQAQAQNVKHRAEVEAEFRKIQAMENEASQRRLDRQAEFQQNQANADREYGFKLDQFGAGREDAAQKQAFDLTKLKSNERRADDTDWRLREGKAMDLAAGEAKQALDYGVAQQNLAAKEKKPKVGDYYTQQFMESLAPDRKAFYRVLDKNGVRTDVPTDVPEYDAEGNPKNATPAQGMYMKALENLYERDPEGFNANREEAIRRAFEYAHGRLGPNDLYAPYGQRQNPAQAAVTASEPDLPPTVYAPAFAAQPSAIRLPIARSVQGPTSPNPTTPAIQPWDKMPTVGLAGGPGWLSDLQPAAPTPVQDQGSALELPENIRKGYEFLGVTDPAEMARREQQRQRATASINVPERPSALTEPLELPPENSFEQQVAAMSALRPPNSFQRPDQTINTLPRTGPVIADDESTMAVVEKKRALAQQARTPSAFTMAAPRQAIPATMPSDAQIRTELMSQGFSREELDAAVAQYKAFLQSRMAKGGR